jgi:hypothetical protein
MTAGLGCISRLTGISGIFALQFDLNALQNGTGAMDDSDENGNQPNNIL